MRWCLRRPPAGDRRLSAGGLRKFSLVTSSMGALRALLRGVSATTRPTATREHHLEGSSSRGAFTYPSPPTPCPCPGEKGTSRLGKSTACKSKHSNRLGAAENPAARLHSTFLLLRPNGASCSSSSPAGAGHPVRLLPCLELSARLFFGASKAAWRLGNAVFLPSFVSLGWRGRELAEPAAPPSVQGSLVHRDVCRELLAQQAGRNQAEKKSNQRAFP